MTHHDWDHVREAAEVVCRAWGGRPKIGLVLGTGLGALAREIESPVAIPYPEIPHFPRSTVAGHAGQLVCGTLVGRPVMAMEGRFHLYEGYTAAQVTFPIRVMKEMGCDLLVVSNADRLGPRFPDMIEPYDKALQDEALKVALEANIVAHRGVYVAVTGPNLETRAEYRFLRGIGADVVGMSTIPEVLVAVHAGIKVLGFSIVTDMCLPDALEPVDIDKIIAVANAAEAKLRTIVRGVLERLPA